MGQAIDQAGADRIADGREHDRQSAADMLHRPHGQGAAGQADTTLPTAALRDFSPSPSKPHYGSCLLLLASDRRRSNCDPTLRASRHSEPAERCPAEHVIALIRGEYGKNTLVGVV